VVMAFGGLSGCGFFVIFVCGKAKKYIYKMSCKM
jgi:hypothetical protein